jgi:hypothetical protein
MYVRASVADPGCLSGIPDPHFYPFRIPDPTKETKREGGQIVSFFFLAKNLTKFKTILFLYRYGTEKNLSQLTNCYITFYPKSCQ